MKNILIFTEYSKKIGMGHFIRSERLYSSLKKKYNCKFYVNKNKKFIKKLLKNKKNFSLVIYDFKNYEKKLIINNKKLYFILFDQSKIKYNNLISINPLALDTRSPYNGPKWFIYPKNFYQKKLKRKYKKKLNLFISQGATDSNNSLKKILKKINYNNNKINKIYVKIPKNNYLGEIKNKKIIKISNIKNLFNLLNKIDLAICGCGNFSYEINFFKIPTVYISDEKNEILRGKKLEKLKLGRFYKTKNLNNALKELDKLTINKDYYLKMVQNKKNFFTDNGLSNIKVKIKKIFHQYED